MRTEMNVSHDLVLSELEYMLFLAENAHQLAVFSSLNERANVAGLKLDIENLKDGGVKIKTKGRSDLEQLMILVNNSMGV